jgi:hypothetical protein
MDENAAAPGAPSPTTPERLAADKIATEYHWPARLGTFDGWARFSDWTAPPEPPPARIPEPDRAG